MDVSIIIVSYNTKTLTYNCLKSVYEQTKNIDFEVIISDNGSTDGSIEMIKANFPQALLIENNENLGFGTANNRGLKKATGKYIFYLNSDTVLLNNAVKIFFDYWETSPEKECIGALGGILLDKNLNTIHSGATFPTYKFLCKEQLKDMILHTVKTFLLVLHLKKFYIKARNNTSTHCPVKAGKTEGFITGADLFIKNNEYAKFDENFFMYFEETDLELKLKKIGLKRFIINDPKIMHLNRKTNNEYSIITSQGIYIQNSSVYYAKKNLNTKATLLKFLISIDRLNPFISKISNKISIQPNIKTFNTEEK